MIKLHTHELNRSDMNYTQTYFPLDGSATEYFRSLPSHQNVLKLLHTNLTQGAIIEIFLDITDMSEKEFTLVATPIFRNIRNILKGKEKQLLPCERLHVEEIEIVFV